MALVCSLCLSMNDVQAHRLTWGEVHSFDNKDTLHTASGQTLSKGTPDLGAHISQLNPLLDNLMVSMMVPAMVCTAWANALPGIRPDAESRTETWQVSRGK